jgi:hypothetical protein
MIEPTHSMNQALAPIPDLELVHLPTSSPHDAVEALGRRVIRQTAYPAGLQPLPWFALHEPHRLGASLHEVAHDQPEVGIRAGQFVLIEVEYMVSGADGFDDDQLVYASAWFSESERRAIITHAGVLKARHPSSYEVHGVVRAVFDRAL